MGYTCATLVLGYDTVVGVGNQALIPSSGGQGSVAPGVLLEDVSGGVVRADNATTNGKITKICVSVYGKADSANPDSRPRAGFLASNTQGRVDYLPITAGVTQLFIPASAALTSGDEANMRGNGGPGLYAQLLDPGDITDSEAYAPAYTVRQEINAATVNTTAGTLPIEVFQKVQDASTGTNVYVCYVR